MKAYIFVKEASYLLASLAFFMSSVLCAQPAGGAAAREDFRFSYSIIEAASGSGEDFKRVHEAVVSAAVKNNGVEYATWVQAEKPSDAPFAGLSDNQLGLMFAWPKNSGRNVEVLDDALESFTSFTLISNRLFEAIYLPSGLEMPTGSGFYVHREEEYLPKDVDEAVRLSKEAWVTWEPHWNVTVIGLFRELGLTDGYENLNRIVWYPSFDAWQETRNFSEDEESAKRFRLRRTLLRPGSGIAIASDRKTVE